MATQEPLELPEWEISEMTAELSKLQNCQNREERNQNQFENKVYLCKLCYLNGLEVVVKITTQAQNKASWTGLARFVWSGSVIGCPNCGEIHRSRQYWYGNRGLRCTVSLFVWNGFYMDLRIIFFVIRGTGFSQFFFPIFCEPLEPELVAMGAGSNHLALLTCSTRM